MWANTHKATSGMSKFSLQKLFNTDISLMLCLFMFVQMDKQSDTNINLPCEAKGISRQKSEQGDSYFSDVFLVKKKERWTVLKCYKHGICPNARPSLALIYIYYRAGGNATEDERWDATKMLVVLFGHSKCIFSNHYPPVRFLCNGNIVHSSK